MAATLRHVVCPACNQVNRVREDRLADGPKCGVCKEALFTGHPIDLHSGNFQQHLTRNDMPVVVDFWAPWCGPCKIMAPTFEQATKRLEPFVRLGKLNTDREPAIATRFGIQGIPTVMILQAGQEIDRRAGVMDLDILIRWIQSHLG